MKKIFLKIVFLTAGVLIAFRFAAIAQQPTEKKIQIPFPIIPVIAEYEYQPYFFAQWITNHPQYSRIEAILDNLEKAASVQIVLIEKDGGKRVYYCASETQAKTLQAEGKEVYPTKIDFKTVQAAAGQPTYGFGFRDKRGQAILWRVVPATRPSERGAGLTPLASLSGLRLEYRDLGTAVGEGTAIQIGDKIIEAEPWTEISAPPYFVAYRGTVAVGRHSGNLLLGARKWQVVSRPDKLKEGAEWIFTDERGRRRIFRITVNNKDELTVSEITGQDTESTPISFVAHNTPQGFAMRSLQLKNRGRQMQIAFSPELPLYPAVSGKIEVAFVISQGKIDKIANGTIIVERVDDKLRLLWQMKSPDWAKSKILETLLKFNSGGYELETTQTAKK